MFKGVNLDVMVMSLENWKCRLEMENESLRHSMVSLQAEVCGARLAARYLDKELAGRYAQQNETVHIRFSFSQLSII